MHNTSAPSRLLILGSCVSRDILNFFQRDQVTLVDYYARSSLAALSTLPVELRPSELAQIASPFRRKTVERETTKALYRNDVACADVDAILIDLIDERFDIYEAAPGAFITASVELYESGFFTGKDRDCDHWVRTGSECHRLLWQRGVERLFGKLKAHGMDQRVIINKVFWADQLEDGAPLPNDDRQKRLLANEHLSWMYSELERYVPAERWLVADSQYFRAAANHRWGVAPFHYVDAYYHQMTRQLVAMLADIREGNKLSVIHRDGFVELRVAIPTCPQRLFAFGISKNGEALETRTYSPQPWMRIGANKEMTGLTFWVHVLDLEQKAGMSPASTRTTHAITYSADKN